MPKFISPKGNLEVWDDMPAGYTPPQELDASDSCPQPEMESALPHNAEPVPQLNVIDVIQHRLDEIQELLAANNQTFVQLFRAKTSGTITDTEHNQLTALEAGVKALHTEQMMLEMQLATLQAMKYPSEVEERSNTAEGQAQSEQEQLSVEAIQELIAKLKQELAEIDAAVVQPMRASFLGTATAEEEALLEELEVKAKGLRVELAGYESKLAAAQDS